MNSKIVIFVIAKLKIWWMPLAFLAGLFVLKKCKKYTKVLSSKYISFWIDRIFFLSLTFTPVIALYCLFSNPMEKLPEIFVKKRPFVFWYFSGKWLIAIFFLVALVLYIIEKILSKSDSLKDYFQRLARYAPLAIGIISLIIGFLCFYELSKIDILTPGKKHDALITYIFYYNFFIFLPFLCHIPAVLITSKIADREREEGGKHLFDYLFNFYRILYLEHPVGISFGTVILSISIAANFLPPPSNDTGNKIEMWQLCLAIVRVLTPSILILTIFGEAVKNFEKLLESDFYRKLRNLISSMNKHTILLGYGYLGKDILGELKEREIVKDKKIINIITPSLEKRKIYKNLLIVDKNAGVFNNSTSDPFYGGIGVIEPESERLPIISPDSPVLTAGIIGDIINKSTYEKAKIQEAELLISAIADYDATNKLVEFLSDKKCNSIITVQDLQQLKLLLPNKVETYNSGTIILLHPSYIEGISLGRVLFSAAARWIKSRPSNNHSKKKPLPKIVITGSGKQIYYLTETYLLGLRQIMGYPLEKTETGKINLDIRILSDEEFYKKNVTKKTFNENLGIETGKWIGIMKSPSTCFTNDVISWDILFSKPDDVNNIKEILNNEEYKPDIIVISHKRADYVIKILDAWINTIINLGKKELNPTILVGTKGKEKKVEKYLEKYHDRLDKLDKNDERLKAFPTQKYDAMVKVYDDTKEQIGSIAEALTKDKPVSLYFCVKNKHGTLARTCNKLANFETELIDKKYMEEKKPSFLNITVQKCPGSPGENTNHRFLIESDVILEKAQNNNKDDDIICSGLVVPTRFKKNINNLLNNENSKCYDKYCICSELCNSNTSSNGNEDSSEIKEVISFAKLYLCSNSYDIPGSVAHVLNNLIFTKTKTKTETETEETKSDIVDLTYTRSYYSFNQKIHKKEFYGNIVSINKELEDERGKLINNPCISFISIHPIINSNNEWRNYMEKLSDFFNQYTNNQASYSLSPNDDSYNIRIEQQEKHRDSCPGTCILAKRCKSLGIYRTEE